MANEIFQDIYKLEIEKMLKEAKYIEPLNHKGVKGTIRELGLRKLLLKSLPTYIKMGTGGIHDYNGRESNETDLLIYNKNTLPPILFDESLGMFPIESILYSIEIKTTSRNQEVKSTIKKFNNLNKLESKNNYKLHKTYFAYKTNLSKKTELQRYFELDDKAKYKPVINVICIVGDGYYYFTRKKIPLLNLINIKDEDYKYAFQKQVDLRKIKCEFLQWQGVRANDNYEVLCFIAGILNTIRNYSIGHYLLNPGKMTSFVQVIKDPLNNVVYENFDYSGLSNDDLLDDNQKFNYKLNDDGTIKLLEKK